MRFWQRRLLALALAGFCQAASAGTGKHTYDVAFSAELLPWQGAAQVTIRVIQSDHLLRVVDLRAPGSRYTRFRGDGDIERDDERLVWTVPPAGGTLSYRVKIDHRRGDAFDARITRRWALLRLDDLFPPARVRTSSGARADATLALCGPDGWSFETGYGPVRGPLPVSNPERRFDRPIGWLLAGELGVRRTVIGDRKISVAAPTELGFRRMDALTFLRWTLPELTAVLPSLPERLLVTSGGPEMWLGALSSPNSLYLHVDRPLVSENATSTLLHELVHVAMQSPPAPGDDWIAEGLAEYYSLTVLERSGGISRHRYDRALASLEQWAERDEGTLADPSTGPNTAYAAVLFHRLDRELKAAGSSLDVVVKQLFGDGEVSRNRLAALVREQLGHPSRVLPRPG